MDYSAVIQDIEDHCGRCKIREALKLLREIQAEFAPAVEAVHSEKPPAAKPIKADQTRTKPVRTQKKPLDPGNPKTRTEKACNKCGKVRPLDQYANNHTCKDGHTGTCKSCDAERHRANYKEKHPPDPISDKPHHCPKCGKGFITKFVMDEHARKCGVAA